MTIYEQIADMNSKDIIFQTDIDLSRFYQNISLFHKFLNHNLLFLYKIGHKSKFPSHSLLISSRNLYPLFHKTSLTNQTQSSEKGAGICYDENKSYQDSFRSGKARRCARKGGTIKTIFYEVKSQRKDERYMYKYVDNAGNMCIV